jgi:hypothetical protein
MGARHRRWAGVLFALSVVAAAGCGSIAGAPATGEIAPIRLRHTQTGVHERCGIDMIREVVRANDLTWSERLFFTWSARSTALRAVQDEERWRQACVDRFKGRGYEVVSGPPAR